MGKVLGNQVRILDGRATVIGELFPEATGIISGKAETRYDP